MKNKVKSRTLVLVLDIVLNYNDKDLIRCVSGELFEVGQQTSFSQSRFVPVLLQKVKQVYRCSITKIFYEKLEFLSTFMVFNHEDHLHATFAAGNPLKTEL